MEKRYQVFVSSTFQDLQVERQEVMHALLELDCIPSGMELFPAANETQWDLIKRVIDDCDYYILILGGRYGSLGPEGISYTEMEYDYALSIEKPTVAFLHRDPGKIEADKTETSEDGREKLKKFRARVGKKLCKHWASAPELGSVVSRSLIQLIKREPAIGWVRANELADRDATIELLKLRKQVDDLKNELSAATISAPKGAERLSQGEEQTPIQYNFQAPKLGNEKWSSWRGSLSVSWNDIFSYISPLMIHETSTPQINSALTDFANERVITQLQKNEEIDISKIYRFSLKPDDLQTVIVQLRALELIAKSIKNRSVKDTKTYWTLTPYGDEMMTHLRAIQRDTTEVFEENIIEDKERNS